MEQEALKESNNHPLTSGNSGETEANKLRVATNSIDAA